MKKIIVSGKGGAGKTTIAAYLIKALLDRNVERILVIDADASYTLPLSLGIELDTQKYGPIGELQFTKTDRSIQSKQNASKQHLDEFIQKSLIKAKIGNKAFDFAYMGHHTNNSCLCGYNNQLRLLLKALEKENMYDLVIIDREAGLEHLTRNVYSNNQDLLVLVTWLSPDYLHVIKEILTTADVLGSTNNRVLIVNDIFGTKPTEEKIEKTLTDENIDLKKVIYFPRVRNIILGKKQGHNHQLLQPNVETAMKQLMEAIELNN